MNTRLVLIYVLLVLLFSFTSYFLFKIFYNNININNSNKNFNLEYSIIVFVYMLLFSFLLLFIFKKIIKKSSKNKKIFKYSFLFLLFFMASGILLAIILTFIVYYLYERQKNKILANNICCYLLIIFFSAIFLKIFTTGYFLTLIIGLLLYDIISVFVTKHMISLAKSAIGLELPLVFIFKEGRMIGAGDLIVSIIYPAYQLVLGNVFGFILSVIIISISGVIGLLVSSLKNKPQPGLMYIVPGILLSMYIFRC